MEFLKGHFKTKTPTMSLPEQLKQWLTNHNIKDQKINRKIVYLRNYMNIF